MNAQILSNWNYFAFIFSILIATISIVILAAYWFLLSSKKKFKSKYEFIALYEIKTLWSFSIMLMISVALFFNANIFYTTTLLLFVRFFITFSIVLIIGTIVRYLLKVYYPSFMEKRLYELRHRPRISPQSGKPMTRLTEDEEDLHLNEGMQAEENVFSVDYDVWRDDETGFILIEKYSGRLQAIECPSCYYRTFRIKSEEVITKPTAFVEGELMKHYQCEYCKYKLRKVVIIKQHVSDEQVIKSAI
jgi:hypothetical protein